MQPANPPRSASTRAGHQESRRTAGATPAAGSGPPGAPAARRGGRIVEEPQQWAPVRPHRCGQGVAGWFLRRPAILRTPRTVTIAPHRWHPGLEPIRCHRGQHVACLAQRCADTRPPLERLEGRQDLRGVGALAACGVEQPWLTDQGQPGLEVEECRMAGAQALAQLTPTRGLAARVGPLQGQGVLPGNPCSHHSCRRGLRESCGKWPHGHERERCRGCRRSPGARKARGTWWVRLARTEHVSPGHLGIPGGERGTGHLAGLFRHHVLEPRGQGHGKPPGVRCDSTGDGPWRLLNPTGNAPSPERRPPQGGAHPEFASDIWSRGCTSGNHT